MTRDDELMAKADEYANCSAHTMEDMPEIRNAWLEGARYVHTDNSTEIERLREQIEKMKCCYNCKKWDCAILECKNDEARIPTCAAYCCDKWEMKE